MFFRRNQVTAQLGIPLQLRFTAYSTAVHPYESHVLLYDGDPAQGNSAIADKFIHPGENGPDGASIWMNWTPATTGNHHLYAVLVEGVDAANPAAQLDVNVTSDPNPSYGKRRR